MKFEGGVVEVNGLRRVIFGKEFERQSIYEWDGDVWLKVDHVGDIIDRHDYGEPSKGGRDAILEIEMTKRIKGATRNSKSRVWISGDTVNVVPVGK